MNYLDNPLKLKFEESLFTGEQMQKLNFGRNPICIYQDYTKHLKRKSTEKNIQDVQQCNDNIIEITKQISKLPVIKLNGFFKRSNKKKYKNEADNNINKTIVLKTFKKQCKIDGCTYLAPTTEALGGHRSRVHSNRSELYIKKQQRREERAYVRERNKSIKKEFCEKRGVNYDELNRTKAGKAQLKEFFFEFRTQFRNFKKRKERKNTSFKG
jgi:hypothetical protein